MTDLPILRGEIWWGWLGMPRGSEPGFRRPVLVIQSNGFNRSGLHTTLIAVITSNQRLANFPGNVLLTKAQSGLPQVSVVNVTQLLTLDRKYLDDRIGRLSPRIMARVDAGLELVLGLRRIQGIDS